MTVDEGDILSNDFNLLQVAILLLLLFLLQGKALFTMSSYFGAEFFHGFRVGKKVGVIVNLMLYSLCLRLQPFLFDFTQQPTSRVLEEEQRGSADVGVFLGVRRERK